MKTIIKIFFQKRCRHHDPSMLRLFTAAELQSISEVSGFPVKGKGVDFAKVGWASDYASIQFKAEEGSEVANRTLKFIEEDLGRIIENPLAAGNERATTLTSDEKRKEIRAREARTIKVDISRVFSKRDLDSSIAFLMEPRSEIAETDHDEYWESDRGYQIIKSTVKKINIGRMDRVGHKSRTFCNGDLKRGMASEGFKGLEFIPCDLIGRSKRDIELFELSSPLILPKLKNQFYGPGDQGKHTEYDDYPGEDGNACLIRDRLHPKQLKFGPEAIEFFEQHDAGITMETVGPGASLEKIAPHRYRFPFLVVSNRFRQWCLSQKLRINFIPIKIV